MTKIYISFIFLFTAFIANAQITFINQNFEEGLPDEWAVYNEDGDENQWEIINQSFWALSGNKAMAIETTTDANDWLVSPQIFLQENYILSFWATEIVEGSEENITIWLSTTGNTPIDFSINLAEITVPYLGYNDEGYLYTRYKIDLSAYQGQNVYIAWQLNSPTQNGLCVIDNITTEYTAENIEWSSISSGFWNNTISTVSDGGFISAGTIDGNIAIQKHNSNGAKEWTTYTNSGNDGDKAYSIIETFNEQDNSSGYIITGTRGMQYDLSMLIWVCKYDTEGTLEWEKDFGISEDQNQGRAIKQTNDGGYIITGYEGLNAQIILIKLDKNGETEWVKRFGNSDIDYASDVVQTADGGYAITGFYKEVSGSDGTILILKIDKDGNEEFLTEYPDTGFARADGICQTADGGFILAAFNNQNLRDWRIIKTDNLGVVEWEYKNGGSQEDIPSSILQTAEGNYIIAGYKTVNDNQRMWIIKLDNNGAFIQETEYENTTGQARIHEIKQTYDGGYIFTGISTAFSANVDGLTIKTIPDETEISQNDILSFYLPEQTQDAEIDEINHTVTITVSDETNITTLTPVIFTSPQSKIFPRSAITQNFSEDFIYTVTALDQTLQEWTIIVEGGYVSDINNIENQISIYPNPSNGIFTINNEQLTNNNGQLTITDITGKIIKQYTITCTERSQSVNLENQPKGIYFLTIKTEKGIYTEKIIIQ